MPSRAARIPGEPEPLNSPRKEIFLPQVPLGYRGTLMIRRLCICAHARKHARTRFVGRCPLGCRAPGQLQ